MPLKLLPLPQPEWQMYYRVCYDAFVPGIMEMMFPNGSYSEAAQHHSLATQQRADTRYPGRTHLLKVVDTELAESDAFGGVVGVSQWKIFPRERTEEEMQEEGDISDKDDAEFGSRPGLNTVAMDDFDNACAALKKKHLARGPHVLLQAIGTRKGHERRGVASLQLAWGTSRADELGVPTYLEASAKGVELYKRWGFEVVDTLPFDARKHGHPEPLTHMCMLRPCRPER